jgi:hypothetical protein
MQQSVVKAGRVVLVVQFFLSAGTAAAQDKSVSIRAACAKKADDFVNSDTYKQLAPLELLVGGIIGLVTAESRARASVAGRCLREAGIDPNAPDPGTAIKKPSDKGARTASKGEPGRGGDCPSYMLNGMSCTDAAGRSCTRTRTGRQCQ